LSQKYKHVVVANGDDSAFYNIETIKSILTKHINSGAKLSFVSTKKEEPFGLGRVLRNSDGKVIGIREDKDASEEEKQIKEVNCGLYVFNQPWFRKNIKKVKISASGEYYLVDLVALAARQGEKIEVLVVGSDEWFGINTIQQLKTADELMRKKLNKNR